jgi:gluconolactonase
MLRIIYTSIPVFVSALMKGNIQMVNKHGILWLAFFILLTILHPSYAQSIIGSVNQAEPVAGGFQFVEGPVWQNGGLLFSDIPANTIYRWTPDSGAFVFLNPSGNSNGLVLDANGNVLMAQHGKRQVARLEPDGSETVLASHYDGKRLNSPNDIAVKSDGALFFTDPPYGINANQEELHFYGIYRLAPSGSLYLLDQTLNRPNGLAFSPDESKLYVGDAETRRIYIWDVVADTVLANKRQFAFMNATGYTDGMKVDSAGNLFASGPFGVWVYAANGTILDTILVPGQTTNCNWGDADGKTLYITSGTAVYRVRPVYTHIPASGMGKYDKHFIQLYDACPNPFNPSTKIEFTIATTEKVILTVYDILGSRIKTLLDGTVNSGRSVSNWDGRDMNGYPASSGIYFYTLRTESGFTQTRKMVLIK